MAGRRRSEIPGTRALRRVLVALVLLVAAAVLILPTSRGVDVTRVDAGPDRALPVDVYVPAAAGPASSPGVVVAHGFAGSSTLMHTWSLALAHAGFVVVAPDLPGHGANTASLDEDGTVLAEAVMIAVGHLLGIPEVDIDRIGLLGHSMGSGAVLDVGVAQPDLVRAVVAVSPTDATVDATAPRDLLLLAGANEARFVANARSLLERAGGAGGTPGDGDARALRVVPLVEHVSILFARPAHDASVTWLAAALGHVPTGTAPTGPLLGWVLLAAGLLVLWQAAVAQAATAAAAPAVRRGAWLVLPLGGVAATASLVIITRSVDVTGLTGLLVAGEVGLWFLMAGTVWSRFGVRPGRPELRDVGWAVLTALFLLAVGASTTLAWAPWWLTGVRVTAAAVLTLLLLPYSVAAAAMLHGRRGLGTVGVWLAASAAVVVTLGAAAVVVPGIGFLFLVLPLLPLVLGVTVVAGAGVDRPWATGAASAAFVGWLLAMLFPLA